MADAFIGTIQTFGFNFPPRNWAFCDGQLIAISQNTALFSLLGTTFGGDGRTTFALPDLRGRSVVHAGSGPGLSPIVWGQKAGAESQSLTSANQLAPHTHDVTIRASTSENDQFAPNNQRVIGTSTTTRLFSTDTANVTPLNPASGVTTSTGAGAPFSIRNPYLGIFTSICLFGIFPSRN